MKQVLSSSVQRKNEEEGSEKRRKLKKGRQISKEGNYFDNHKLHHKKTNMKTAFTIALTVAAANASGLRSQDTPKDKKGGKQVSRNLDVHDTQFIETLASRYNCREAGASLES